MALYATIRNHGTRDDTLFAIETPVAGSASVHETVLRGGMATMAPVAHLVIPAGAQVRLEPAGTHAMLESLTRGFVAGDSLPVVFVFANGRRVDVTARVVAYEHLLDALRGETEP
jgi:copper(I)-binding protein